MKKLIFFITFLGSVHAQAQSIQGLFEEHFYRHYVARQCTDNIRNFLKELKKNRLLRGKKAEILRITNKGVSVFGFVNAEYARHSGRRGPNGVLFPGERNWHFHVVLLLDGDIYDFDYSNEPQVLSLEDYIEEMFLDELSKEEGGNFIVPREKKLNDYEVQIFEDEDMNSKLSYKMRLGELLR